MISCGTDAFTARSYLFVPGNRPDRFAKAWAADPDAVIIDLEDSVPPADKIAARASVGAYLSAARPVIIRINDANTEWFRDDVALCGGPGIGGVVLAKAERTEDIRFLAERVASATPILPLIETAKGFWNVAALAGAERVQRLIFGSIDFQIDLGIAGDDDELLYFRSQLVLVSRISGIQAPVDGVTTDIHSSERVRNETLRSKRLGFGAKLCIHPKQVSVVNDCFTPTPEEEAWARRVTAAAAAAHGGAISVDGEMVDRPVITKAESILSAVKQMKR
jgi:citrate lyase subunit beta / citryl-CoA lyase